MPNGYPKFSMFWISLHILSSTFALLSALFLPCPLYLQITSTFWLFSPLSLLPLWFQVSSSFAWTSAIAPTRSLCIPLAPPIFSQLRSHLILLKFVNTWHSGQSFPVAIWVILTQSSCCPCFLSAPVAFLFYSCYIGIFAFPWKCKRCSHLRICVLTESPDWVLSPRSLHGSLFTHCESWLNCGNLSGCSSKIASLTTISASCS